MPELANDPECRLTLWQVDQVRSDFAIENDLQFIMGQLARVPDRGWLSRMLLLGGSADRSPTARPCRPATVFDFRPPPARAPRQGKCWRCRAPPRAIDYSYGLNLFKAQLLKNDKHLIAAGPAEPQMQPWRTDL